MDKNTKLVSLEDIFPGVGEFEPKTKKRNERDKINKILDKMNPRAALDLLHSITKERKKENIKKIYSIGINKVIDHERPDLQIMRES